MVDVAGVDQLPDKIAPLGRARQGREQREQFLTVARARVLLERLPERLVLGCGLPRDSVDVGRDEGKRGMCGARVLRQVEADTADHVPDRALCL